MAILKTLSLAQLQTFQHVLQEMEAAGLFNLSEARLVVHHETSARHQAKQRRYLVKNQGPYRKQPAYVPLPCPTKGCGGQLLPVISGEGAQVQVLGCKKCRYSTLVEA